MYEVLTYLRHWVCSVSILVSAPSLALKSVWCVFDYYFNECVMMRRHLTLIGQLARWRNDADGVSTAPIDTDRLNDLMM